MDRVAVFDSVYLNFWFCMSDLFILILCLKHVNMSKEIDIAVKTSNLT
jgi:hypothetical protein